MTGKVKAGVSTFSLGGVTVTAYVLAVLAFVDGQHDTTTVGLVATGTVALVTMAAGRFWQAVEKIRTQHETDQRLAQLEGRVAQATKGLSGVVGRDLARGQAKQEEMFGTTFSGSTTTVPRPSATVKAETVGVDEDAPDVNVSPPDKSIADPALDDPGDVPTREKHSRLKG